MSPWLPAVGRVGLGETQASAGQTERPWKARLQAAGGEGPEPGGPCRLRWSLSSASEQGELGSRHWRLAVNDSDPREQSFSSHRVMDSEIMQWSRVTFPRKIDQEHRPERRATNLTDKEPP